MAWRWVLDPAKVQWIAYWDLVTTVALILTSTVTPVEVAFLQPLPMDQKLVDVLFWLNRTVDAIFIFDMHLQFRVAVRLPGTEIRWLRNPKEIAMNYLQSKWFWIDLFSVLTMFFDLVGGEDVRDLVVLRAIRVLRLAKLIRLMKGSRLFKAWEMKLSINYQVMELFSLSIFILINCHWWACIWGLQASFAPLDSWPGGKGYCVPWGDADESMARQMLAEGDCATVVLDGIGPSATYAEDCSIGRCVDGTCTGGYACAGWSQLYLSSIYFAVMTITSVGYGDVVAVPFNKMELLLVSIIMLLTGMLWGYLIGTFATIAAGLSPTKQAFQQDLSALNGFMSKHAFPNQTRFRMREYFHETYDLRIQEVESRLIENLSPAMQAEVSYMVNSKWIRSIWYLEKPEISSNHELRIELAAQLTHFVFPPGEFCPNGFLYIIQRGSALYAGRMMRDAVGYKSYWGDDIVLRADLQLDFPALSASYMQVLAIDAESIQNVILKFPTAHRVFASVRHRWAVRRCFVQAAERRSFAATGQFRGRHRPLYAKELRRDDENLGDHKALRLSDLGYTDMSWSMSRNSVAAHKRTFARRMSMKKSPSMKKPKKPTSKQAVQRLKQNTSKLDLASVQSAVTNFGLGEMRQLMEKKIEHGSASEARIDKLDDKISAISKSLESMDRKRGETLEELMIAVKSVLERMENATTVEAGTDKFGARIDATIAPIDSVQTKAKAVGRGTDKLNA